MAPKKKNEHLKAQLNAMEPWTLFGMNWPFNAQIAFTLTLKDQKNRERGKESSTLTK